MFSLIHIFLKVFKFCKLILLIFRYLNLVAVIVWIILYFPLICCLPESPRWLLSRQRFTDVKQFLIKVARCNRRPLTLESCEEMSSTLSKMQAKEPKLESYSIVSLFRTPNLRKKTLILVLLNCCNKSVQNGMKFYLPNFSPNPHLSAFLSSSVEFLPYLFAKATFERFGRRFVLFLGFFLGAIAFLSAITVAHFSPNAETGPVYQTVLSLILAAQFCITLTYLTSKLVEDEIFPTVVRSNGHAMVSFLSAIAFFPIPFIVDLGFVSKIIPLSVFGGLCLISSFSIFFLPGIIF